MGYAAVLQHLEDTGIDTEEENLCKGPFLLWKCHLIVPPVLSLIL